MTRDMKQPIPNYTPIFTIANPTGKCGYAYSLADARFIAGSVGGGHIHLVTQWGSEGLGWHPPDSDCRYEVIAHIPWPFPRNVSSGYVIPAAS